MSFRSTQLSATSGAALPRHVFVSHRQRERFNRCLPEGRRIRLQVPPRLDDPIPTDAAMVTRWEKPLTIPNTSLAVVCTGGRQSILRSAE